MQEKLKLETPDEVFAAVAADEITREAARYRLLVMGIRGYSLAKAALEYAERERVPFPGMFATWLSH